MKPDAVDILHKLGMQSAIRQQDGDRVLLRWPTTRIAASVQLERLSKAGLAVEPVSTGLVFVTVSKP